MYKRLKKSHTFAENVFKAGDKVLLKNLSCEDRKSGWTLKSWLGPNTINKILSNKLCTIQNEKKILKTKQLITNIIKYY